MNKIPEKMLEIIDYAIGYIGTESLDWFKIKRELVNLTPPRDRSLFSRRHYSTKKHILNLFDKQVINYWEQTLGVKLWIDPDKLHPENWVQKPHGWAIREINEQRQRSKEKA